MDIVLLRTFLKAAELKNFYKVSQSLGYAPSTITMQIKKLEQDLGYPLFDRVDNKIQLTEGGKEFIPYAKRIISLVEESKTLTRDEENPTGHINLGAIGSFISCFMEEYLTSFSIRYPHVHINIRVSNSRPLCEMLKLGECDVVICINDSFFDADFGLVAELPSTVVFMAAKENKLVNRKRIPLEEVFSQPLILTEYRGIYRRKLENLAAEKKLAIEPLIGVEYVDLVIKLVSKNLGITFLPDFCIYNKGSQGQLRILDVDAKLPKMKLQVFYNRKKWVSPALKKFIGFIKNGPVKIFSRPAVDEE